jgi:hypothetical protein
VYGGLLTATLYVRLLYKTVPELHHLGEQLGKFAGETVRQVGKTMAVAFAAFVDEAFGDVLGRFGRMSGWVAYLCALGLFGTMAWKTCPTFGGKVRYA